MLGCGKEDTGSRAIARQPVSIAPSAHAYRTIIDKDTQTCYGISDGSASSVVHSWLVALENTLVYAGSNSLPGRASGL